jgi:L-fucose mutarotase
MLQGIDPILTGELLAHLDAMGHADGVVVSDAHFPAQRMARRLVTLPTIGATEVIRALRTVLPLDTAPAFDVMESEDGSADAVHADLCAAAGVTLGHARTLARAAFYAEAERAYLVIRTGETRPFGNAIMRKGLVTV